MVRLVRFLFVFSLFSSINNIYAAPDEDRSDSAALLDLPPELRECVIFYLLPPTGWLEKKEILELERLSRVCRALRAEAHAVTKRHHRNDFLAQAGTTTQALEIGAFRTAALVGDGTIGWDPTNPVHRSLVGRPFRNNDAGLLRRLMDEGAPFEIPAITAPFSPVPWVVTPQNRQVMWRFFRGRPGAFLQVLGVRGGLAVLATQLRAYVVVSLPLSLIWQHFIMWTKFPGFRR